MYRAWGELLSKVDIYRIAQSGRKESEQIRAEGADDVGGNNDAALRAGRYQPRGGGMKMNDELREWMALVLVALAGVSLGLQAGRLLQYLIMRGG